MDACVRVRVRVPTRVERAEALPYALGRGRLRPSSECRDVIVNTCVTVWRDYIYRCILYVVLRSKLQRQRKDYYVRQAQEVQQLSRWQDARDVWWCLNTGSLHVQAYVHNDDKSAAAELQALLTGAAPCIMARPLLNNDPLTEVMHDLTPLATR